MIASAQRLGDVFAEGAPVKGVVRVERFFEAVEKLGHTAEFFPFVMPCFVLSRRSGGTPLMMGQQTRNESLFYYFRLEEQIPDDHLLRLIDRYIDLSFLRKKRPPVQELSTA